MRSALDETNWKIRSHKKPPPMERVICLQMHISIKRLELTRDPMHVVEVVMIFHRITSALAPIINILLLLNMRCSPPRSSPSNCDHVQSISLQAGKSIDRSERQWQSPLGSAETAWRGQRIWKFPVGNESKTPKKRKILFEKRTHNYRNNEKCCEEIEEKSSINRSCTNTLECLFRLEISNRFRIAHKNNDTRKELTTVPPIKLFINNSDKIECTELISAQLE